LPPDTHDGTRHTAHSTRNLRRVLVQVCRRAGHSQSLLRHGGTRRHVVHPPLHDAHAPPLRVGCVVRCRAPLRLDVVINWVRRRCSTG
jgi:hypothetical protein